jgi:hypothetical protein
MNHTKYAKASEINHIQMVKTGLVVWLVLVIKKTLPLKSESSRLIAHLPGGPE